MILSENMVQKTRFFPHKMVGIGLGIAAILYWATIVPMVADLATGRAVVGLESVGYIAMRAIAGIGLTVGCAGLVGAMAARDRIFSAACLVVALNGLWTGAVGTVNLGLTAAQGIEPLLPASIWFSIPGRFLFALALLMGGLAYTRGDAGRGALLAWAFAILALSFVAEFGQRMMEFSPPWTMLESLDGLSRTITQLLSVVISAALAYLYFRNRQVLAVQKGNWLAKRDLLVVFLAIVYLLPPDQALWSSYWQWYVTPIDWVYVIIPVCVAVGFLVSWWRRGGFVSWRQKLADIYWAD